MSAIDELGRSRTQDRLARALLVSLLFHAAVLALEFGEPGTGLPWLDATWSGRRAEVPSISALLRPLSAEPPAPERAESDRKIEPAAVRPRPAAEQRGAGRAEAIAPPLALPDKTSASLQQTPIPSEPQPPPAKAPELAPRPQPAPPSEERTPVLATEEPSDWRVRAERAAREAEEAAKNAAQKGREDAEARRLADERARSEELARIAAEQAEQASLARAREETETRRRNEEQKRMEEQKRLEEIARADKERAQQLALAKAAEELEQRRRLDEQRLSEERKRLEETTRAAREAQAKAQAEARAQSEARAQAEAKAQAEARAQTEARVAGDARAAVEAASRAGAGGGSELAQRALNQARGGLLGTKPQALQEADRSRRGSLLGRDPRDVELAFYGEDWRLKVERVGALNYPRLSKNLSYEALRVTVSINADGSLAGVRIDRSSGHKDMDDAVRRIVEMAAPFAAFPPALRRRFDVVDITREWAFTEELPRMLSR